MIDSTQNKKPSRKNIISFLIILTLVFGIGVLVGQSSPILPFEARLLNRDASESRNLDFRLFWQVWDELDRQFYKQPISEKDRFYGAIKGMVASLNDPYTMFMTPDETKQFQDDLQGKFEGIGIEIGMRDNHTTVIAPIAGSPAAKAGLRAQDVITAIDGTTTKGMALDVAVSKIRGKAGTQVKLTIARAGKADLFDVTVTRDTINVASVTLTYDGDVAHVVLSRFGETTTKEFDDIAKQIKAKKTSGIVLDLRNDGGGYLNAAVDIASRFIPEGTIVTQQDGSGKKIPYRATGGASLNSYKVVVLMNEGSASASEILAGALRDRKNVKLVGTKSYGKGSVQDVETLSDGSSLRVTIAKWLTPNGQNLNGNGLDPDVKVELSDADIQAGRDPQYAEAKVTLNK
jgi:carboxyl-terminal processing protease